MKTVAEFTLKRINEKLHVKQVLNKDKVIHCSIVSSLEETHPEFFEPRPKVTDSFFDTLKNMHK